MKEKYFLPLLFCLALSLKNCPPSYLQKTSVSPGINVISFLISAGPPLVGGKSFCHATEVKPARCCLLGSWNTELYEMAVQWEEVMFFCLTPTPWWDKKEFWEEEAHTQITRSTDVCPHVLPGLLSWQSHHLGMSTISASSVLVVFWLVLMILSGDKGSAA